MSADPRVVYQVASWCLDYPGQALLEQLGTLTAAVAEGGRAGRGGSRSGRSRGGRRGRAGRDESSARLSAFLDHVGETALVDLQRHYVDVFDMNHRHALYLSYWTDGDTRRRGEALTAFQDRYRASGFRVSTGGELPDYLPMVLEYAALVDPGSGSEVLRQYRPSLELLRIALTERGTPYLDVLIAVCETLPGESPRDRAAVMRMAAAGPPAETVGLDAYDPRPSASFHAGATDQVRGGG